MHSLKNSIISLVCILMINHVEVFASFNETSEEEPKPSISGSFHEKSAGIQGFTLEEHIRFIRGTQDMFEALNQNSRYPDAMEFRFVLPSEFFIVEKSQPQDLSATTLWFTVSFRHDVSVSAALDAMLIPSPTKYVIDCSAAFVLSMLNGLRSVLSQEDFELLFSEMRETSQSPLCFLNPLDKMREPFINIFYPQTKKMSTPLFGAWLVVSNHPLYPYKRFDGTFPRHNVIYMSTEDPIESALTLSFAPDWNQGKLTISELTNNLAADFNKPLNADEITLIKLDTFNRLKPLAKPQDLKLIVEKSTKSTIQVRHSIPPCNPDDLMQNLEFRPFDFQGIKERIRIIRQKK